MTDPIPFNKLTIRAWADEDRPREKLMNKGVGALSDAELLAILIGSGNRNETAVSLCQRIGNKYKNSLQLMSKASVNELIQFKGIGEAKAISIVAALELGRRRQQEAVLPRQQIKSSQDAYLIFGPLLGDLPHEEFWVLFLNRSNKVISKKRISAGGVTGTVADVRLIFKEAINALASGIILCHNHPSGNLLPSEADIQLTKRMKSAGVLLEVSVLDHLIVTDAGYYSFSDESRL